MLSYLESVILGLVQGLTEFLPVSSSGHLKIFGALLNRNLEGSLTFDILLHAGTLLAVIVVYYKDILLLIQNFFGMLWDIVRFKGVGLAEHPYRRVVLMLFVGSIPAGLGSIFLKEHMESIPIWAVGIFLLVTAALLFWSDRMESGTKSITDITPKNALICGVFQMFALLPGISRSGSTIVGGSTQKLKREDAVKFSFLLSLISVGGAALLEIPAAVEQIGQVGSILPLIVGMAVAAVSGFFAIRFLISMAKKSSLSPFGIYCTAMGISSIIYGIITHS